MAQLKIFSGSTRPCNVAFGPGLPLTLKIHAKQQKCRDTCNPYKKNINNLLSIFLVRSKKQDSGEIVEYGLGDVCSNLSSHVRTPLCALVFSSAQMRLSNSQFLSLLQSLLFLFRYLSAVLTLFLEVKTPHFQLVSLRYMSFLLVTQIYWWRRGTKAPKKSLFSKRVGGSSLGGNNNWARCHSRNQPCLPLWKETNLILSNCIFRPYFHCQ